MKNSSPSKTGSFSAVLAVLCIGTLSSPAITSAQCASLEAPTSQYLGDRIHLVPGGGMTNSLINGAIAMWNSGCPSQMGVDFPTLQNGGSGGASYTVTYAGHNASDAHCGEHVGPSVIIFQTSTDPSGNRQICGNITMNIAHEIGHILGLNDAPLGTSCQHRIMAWINHNNAYSRTVSPEECSKVDSKWRTSQEPSGGGGPPEYPCPEV